MLYFKSKLNYNSSRLLNPSVAKILNFWLTLRANVSGKRNKT
jgi:hypothetical protein